MHRMVPRERKYRSVTSHMTFCNSVRKVSRDLAQNCITKKIMYLKCLLAECKETIYLFNQLQSEQLNIYLKTVFIYLIWACTALFTLDGSKLSQWNPPLKSKFLLMIFHVFCHFFLVLSPLPCVSPLSSFFFSLSLLSTPLLE